MLTERQVKRMYDLGLLWSKETSFDFEYDLGLLWSKETSFDFELEIEEMSIVADKCRMFVLQKVMRECGYTGKFPDMPYEVDWIGDKCRDIFFYVYPDDLDSSVEQCYDNYASNEPFFHLWNGWGGSDCLYWEMTAQSKLAELALEFMGAKPLGYLQNLGITEVTRQMHDDEEVEFMYLALDEAQIFIKGLGEFESGEHLAKLDELNRCKDSWLKEACLSDFRDCKNSKELNILKQAMILIIGDTYGNRGGYMYDVAIHSMGGMFVPLPEGYRLPFKPDSPLKNAHECVSLTYLPDGVRFIYSLGVNEFSDCDEGVCNSLITDVVGEENWHVAYSALTELWCVYAMTKGGCN